MSYLLDTGILLRMFDRSDPQFPQIRDVLRRLRVNSERIVTTEQNLAEFWNVSTRPTSARGGYGISVQWAARRLAFLQRLCVIEGGGQPAFEEWKRLLVSCNVQGSKVHNARIAALMLASGVSHIITLNVADFSRFPGIIALRPTDVLSAP